MNVHGLTNWQTEKENVKISPPDKMAITIRDACWEMSATGLARKWIVNTLKTSVAA